MTWMGGGLEIRYDNAATLVDHGDARLRGNGPCADCGGPSALSTPRPRPIPREGTDMAERTPKTCVTCTVPLGEAVDPRVMYCRPCYNTKRAALRKSIRLKARAAIVGGEDWHGTLSGYCNNLCRCDDCTRASRDYHRAHEHRPEIRERRRQQERIASKAPHRRLRARAKRYGLTNDALAVMLAEERCTSCGTTDPGSRGWQIDHDHSCCSGKAACGKCVRGIICSSCNVALGAVNDDPVQLLALVRYLNRGSHASE